MTQTPPGQGRSGWWIWGLVLAGLALRAYHFFRVPSVWHDEAALLMNVLKLSYADLLGPLLWHEAAPPLFLWVERAMFLSLGDHILVLRALPFLASCLALILMVPIARRLLPSSAVPWAVFLFAASEQLAWHACEAKPYALDVLAAVLVLNTHCAGRARSLRWSLAWYIVLAPILIWLSYPSCFLLGGVLVAALLPLWKQRTTGNGLAYLGLAVVVLGSFLLLALGPARAQKDGAMMSCWLHFFPDWSQSWSVPGWLITSTVGVFRYCCKPAGEGLLLLGVLGGYLLWRQGQRQLVLLLLVPIVLALLAACAWRYPYGGARVLVYAAPAVALLAGCGIPVALNWLRARHRLALVVGLVVVLLPAYSATRSVVRPWARPDTANASAFVSAQRSGEEMILGNDWTHHYYFRAQSRVFRENPDEVRHCDRVWVVYTDLAQADQRQQSATQWLRGSWRVLQHRDFAWTTVLLVQREEQVGVRE